MKHFLFLILIAPSLALADTNITAKRNTAATIQFELRDAEGATPGLVLEAAAVCVAGDAKVVIDGAVAANATNCFVDETLGSYSIALTAAQLAGKITTVVLVDQTATKVWVDKVLNVYTYGDASAFHIPPVVDVTKWNGTAVATPDTAGYPVVTIKDGTGVGEIDTLSGSVVTTNTVTTLTNLPAITANWLTATGIATGAITSTKFAASAINAAAIATGAITSLKFAAGAITATVLATDAIGAAQIASGAIVKGVEITGFNDLSAVQVNAEADTALADYDAPTKAELDTAVANVSVDSIQATALADLFDTNSGTTYASAVAGSVVKEIADNAGGSSLTVQQIVDGVLNEATSAHPGAGTVGRAITDGVHDGITRNP